MEKKKFDFRQYRHEQIGGIYNRLNTFFKMVQTNLNADNLPLYEEQYNAIWSDAKKIMLEDKYNENYTTNTKRWERIKQPFLPTKTPVQPTQTPQVYNYIPTEKSAENRAEMMPDDKDKEIARLKQIIENKDIIIQSLLRLNELQPN